MSNNIGTNVSSAPSFSSAVNTTTKTTKKPSPESKTAAVGEKAIKKSKEGFFSRFTKRKDSSGTSSVNTTAVVKEGFFRRIFINTKTPSTSATTSSDESTISMRSASSSSSASSSTVSGVTSASHMSVSSPTSPAKADIEKRLNNYMATEGDRFKVLKKCSASGEVDIVRLLLQNWQYMQTKEYVDVLYIATQHGQTQVVNCIFSKIQSEGTMMSITLGTVLASVLEHAVKENCDERVFNTMLQNFRVFFGIEACLTYLCKLSNSNQVKGVELFLNGLSRASMTQKEFFEIAVLCVIGSAARLERSIYGPQNLVLDYIKGFCKDHRFPISVDELTLFRQQALRNNHIENAQFFKLWIDELLIAEFLLENDKTVIGPKATEYLSKDGITGFLPAIHAYLHGKATTEEMDRLLGFFKGHYETEYTDQQFLLSALQEIVGLLEKSSYNSEIVTSWINGIERYRKNLERFNKTSDELSGGSSKSNTIEDSDKALGLLDSITEGKFTKQCEYLMLPNIPKEKEEDPLRFRNPHFDRKKK